MWLFMLPSVVFFLAAIVWWLSVGGRRRRYGCRVCGYPPDGVVGEVCPECGTRWSEQGAARTDVPRWLTSVVVVSTIAVSMAGAPSVTSRSVPFVLKAVTQQEVFDPLLLACVVGPGAIAALAFTALRVWTRQTTTRCRTLIGVVILSAIGHMSTCAVSGVAQRLLMST